MSESSSDGCSVSSAERILSPGSPTMMVMRAPLAMGSVEWMRSSETGS